jgi:hypothetical protein
MLVENNVADLRTGLITFLPKNENLSVIFELIKKSCSPKPKKELVVEGSLSNSYST